MKTQIVYVSESAGLTKGKIASLIELHNTNVVREIPAGETRASFVCIHHQEVGRPLLTVEIVGENRRDFLILTWDDMLTMPNLRAQILMLMGTEFVC